MFFVSAHKNTIQHGYKQIKNKGSYIITEEKGLEKATKRWKQFLEERLPHWKNLRGDDISITRENYFRALHDKDIYLLVYYIIFFFFTLHYLI